MVTAGAALGERGSRARRGGGAEPVGAVQRLMRETVINGTVFESKSLVRVSRLKAANFLLDEPPLEVRVSVRPFLGAAVPPRVGAGRSSRHEGRAAAPGAVGCRPCAAAGRCSLRAPER